MRIYPLILLLVFSSLSCTPKPDKTRSSAHAEVPPATLFRDETQESAIWLATTNYTSGGFLARLDLQSGALEQTVLPVAADAQIFRGKDQQMLLLTRSQNDAIALLSGPKAKVLSTQKLVEGANPQMACVDADGKIWLTALDLNSVQVFDANLSTLLGTVNLEALREDNSPDSYAELAQVQQMDSSHVAVTALRLRRGLGYWKPEPESGLAILNSQTLQVESTHLLKVANPSSLYVAFSNLFKVPEIFILGSGDLYSAEGAPSSIGRWQNSQRISGTQRDFSFRVLASHFLSATEPPALIAWYQNENKSCVQLGETPLLCEGSSENGGYVFNKILRYGHQIYVSYIASQSSQLWIIPTEGGDIQKIQMQLPIESMSFGP